MIIYIIPILTAFVGWLSVFIIERLMLKAITANQQPIIRQLINSLLNDLSPENLTVHLKNHSSIESLTPIIEQHIDTFLKVKLQEKIPMLATFMGESTFAKIKAGMMEEIQLLLPEVIDQYINKAIDKEKIKQLADSFLTTYNPDFKQLYASQFASKVSKAKYIATFAGFMVGLIELWLLSL